MAEQDVAVANAAAGRLSGLAHAPALTPSRLPKIGGGAPGPYDGGVGVLTRIWNAIRRPRRTVSSVELLQRAERCRREGRFEEGAALAREALRLEPRSTLAHLLAGYLHAALREPAAAGTAFRAALALDPEHPRAMLGLARIALERGDIGICRELSNARSGFTLTFPRPTRFWIP